jgi:hypothetical protein
VVDRGEQFRHLELSPRWMAAGKDHASVTVRYAPTGETIRYDYAHDRVKKTITLAVHGKMETVTLRLLLPPSIRTAKAKVDGQAIKARAEKVNGSFYIVADGLKGAVKMEVKY